MKFIKQITDVFFVGFGILNGGNDVTSVTDN